MYIKQNDVCNGHLGFSHMTPPDKFEASVLENLATLDATLPPGSHVVLVGMADGRVLWDFMHNRTHPLGVQYVDLYNFLNWCVCVCVPRCCYVR